MIPVVGEIGVNHNGSVDKAIELAKIAAEAGCRYVKLQFRTPELCVPKDQWGVQKLTPWGETMDYISYREEMEFDQTDLEDFHEMCMAFGIKWTASAWDIPSLERLLVWKPDFVKIPSAKLTDAELLHAAAASGTNVWLSTGMSTTAEVDDAVDILHSHRAYFMLLHCHSQYPAPPEEANLSLMENMRQWYRVSVGYSCHTVSPFPAIHAVAMGAEALEVHITTDRSLPGSDHAASQEPQGLRLIMREVKRIEMLRGDGRRRVYEGELPALMKLRGVI